MSFGELAVDCFFVLSGYLIVQSWCSQPNAIIFFQKRALRIYPGFIVASLICAFVVGPLSANPPEYFSHFLKRAFLNGLLFLDGPFVPKVFAGAPYPSVNGSLWTIHHEFECYLLVLVFGILAGKNWRFLWLLTTGFILGFVLLNQNSSSEILSYPLFRLSSFFFCGGCFFFYKEKIKFNSKILWIMSSTLLVGMFSPRWSGLAVATAGAYIIFFVATKPIRQISWFNKLPDVSYGTYLYGWPIQMLLIWYFPIVSPWVLFIWAALLSIILGAISWYAIEKPFISLKTRLPKARSKYLKLDSE